MTNGVTFYPGAGADVGIAELYNLVGEITATWAGVEDELFNLFVLAIAGTWLVGHITPYRSVFFTFSSYEAKMRMLNNAMKARYEKKKEVTDEWNVLRKSLNDFAELRNEVAHLIPMTKSSTDPEAKANVRLVPPFWKSAFQEYDFDTLGYSRDELLQAIAPYWGYHPRINRSDVPGSPLGYRLHEFTMKLMPPIPPPQAAPIIP